MYISCIEEIAYIKGIYYKRAAVVEAGGTADEDGLWEIYMVEVANGPNVKTYRDMDDRIYVHSRGRYFCMPISAPKEITPTESGGCCFDR